MISKSNYKQYENCPKSLWLYLNAPKKAESLGDLQKQQIEDGNLVGEQAKKYFPNTVDCSVTGKNGMPDCAAQISATETAMQNGADAMAEASFSNGKLYCAVDILKKEDGGYAIYEVKSALEGNQSHWLDIAFQKYVLEQCGINVKHIYLMHPNRDYIFQGALNLKQYFSIQCLDTAPYVQCYYGKIASELPKIDTVMQSTAEPAVPFSGSCKDCAFKKYCTRNIPEDNVGEIIRMGIKAYDFYNKGIFTIAEYAQTPEYKKAKANPKKAEENHRRDIQIQKACNKDSTPYVDKAALKTFLDGIRYPIYHLDFETTRKIVPAFEGFRPGEGYPFQYSLHIEYADGTLEHKAFLGEEENCIRALAEQLVKDIPQDAQLLAFHAVTERNLLKYLAGKFPDLSAHLMNLSQNFVDLLDPFQKGVYFDPKQRGSNSIKEVMPALCPQMANAYHQLPVVHNGGGALAMFTKMLAMKGTPDYEIVRDGMLKYCELDTLSMVEILKVLRAAAL